MLTDIVLSPDENSPEKINFDEFFNYAEDKKLQNIISFKAKVDTSNMTLSYLGDFLPKLQILRLDYSRINNLRDLSTPLKNLKVLYLTHCNLTSIEGISTISCNIYELYLSFNLIDDISPLLDFDNLNILDLESNEIKDINDVSLLSCCNSLKNLTLRGTNASKNPEYRSLIKKIIPQLQILDGVKLNDGKKEEIIQSKTKSQFPPIIMSSSSKTLKYLDQQNIQKTKLPPLQINKPKSKNIEKQNKNPKNFRIFSHKH